MKLGMFSFNAFQFDGYFLARWDVCTQIYVTKWARTNFSAQSIPISNSQLHFFHRPVSKYLRKNARTLEDVLKIVMS